MTPAQRAYAAEQTAFWARAQGRNEEAERAADIAARLRNQIEQEGSAMRSYTAETTIHMQQATGPIEHGPKITVPVAVTYHIDTAWHGEDAWPVVDRVEMKLNGRMHECDDLMHDLFLATCLNLDEWLMEVARADTLTNEEEKL